MKADQLHDLWVSPDNSRLTSKQFSFRLPVHIAAKIAALGDMYPQKTRTQLVADLLTSALDELEKNLPELLGRPLDPAIQDHIRDEYIQLGEKFEPHYYLGGPRGEFRERANKHFKELEKEMGNENPATLYPDLSITESQVKTKK